MISNFSFLASGNHKKCFICGKKNNYRILHRINKLSIIEGYYNHRIIIKESSRSCRIHLDENYNIKSDHFKLIKTSVVEKRHYNQNYMRSKNSGIFEIFRDTSCLDDEKCKEITGWTKTSFIRLCKFITSFNDSNGRTLEECVAIYRFWLRKGIDQTSLAYTKKNTSQQQISHYLAQIRTAINRDFVPFWLGAKKTRDFYVKHNNQSVNELHNLTKNDLVLIADGTYLKIEKSHNNDVQYLTYSGQKKTSLIKPFLITCADGWIVDIWGPYGGKFNDQQIIEHIFDTDQDLQNIMKPYSSLHLFLDRGN